jgi:putative DNA primase/helicase
MIDFNVVIPFPLPEKSNYDRDAILATLQTTAYRWVPELFPQGKIDHVKNQLRVADISGRPPRNKGSCVIDLDGEFAGSYRDFGIGGQHGDAVATIADHFGVDRLDALKKAFEIADQYGRVDAHKAPAPKRSTSADDHLRLAQYDLDKSGPAAGTLAETYFAARGLSLPATDDLRFSDDCTHWETKTGKPALIAVIRYPDGRPTGGIHRIYLKDDGSWHTGDKMMLGPVDGGVVMLAPMTDDGTLGIAEGIETAAAAMQMTGIPCWSTLSAGGMRKLAAWISERGSGNVRRLVIFADIGSDGETAAAQLRAAAAAAGINAEVRLPRGGDDFCDDLVKGLTPDPTSAVSRQEIIPPASAADFESEIQTLGRLDIKAATLIERIVGAGLHPFEVDRLMAMIRVQTSFTSEVIKKTVKDATKQIRKVGEVRTVNWWSKLERNENGEPRPILSNIVTALREDPAWQDVLAFNEFTEWITLRNPSPWEADRTAFRERPWTDADGRRATIWIQKAGIHADSKVVFEAVTAVAEESLFHPVREYLDSLVWDGKPRLTDWLATYLGATPTPIDDDLIGEDRRRDRERYDANVAYLEAIGPRWMIGAVRRIYRPGEKVDSALILIGPQGILKSTVFDVLGSPWFTDQVPDLRGKDAPIQLAGIWIVEFAEMTNIRSAEISQAKKWMTIRQDRYRAPYGRQSTDHPRQSVFGGTTNDEECLHDATGARRFWGVNCVSIDIEALRRDRDQLWAEAVYRHRAGEPHWLDTDDLKEAAAAEAEEHYSADPWEQPIRDWLILTKKEATFTATVLDGALLKPKSDWTKNDEMRVATCLRRLGWTKGKQIASGENRGKRPFLAPKDWP